MEAVINHLVNKHLWASYTYLSVGFFFNCSDVVLEGMGHFFHSVALEGMGHFFYKWVKEKCKGTQHLLKMQNQSCSRSLFQDMQKRLKTSWVKPRML